MAESTTMPRKAASGARRPREAAAFAEGEQSLPEALAPDEQRAEEVIRHEERHGRATDERIREPLRADVADPEERREKEPVGRAEQQGHIAAEPRDEAEQAADRAELNHDADQRDGDEVRVGAGEGPAAEIVGRERDHHAELDGELRGEEGAHARRDIGCSRYCGSGGCPPHQASAPDKAAGAGRPQTAGRGTRGHEQRPVEYGRAGSRLSPR